MADNINITNNGLKLIVPKIFPNPEQVTFNEDIKKFLTLSLVRGLLIEIL